LYRKYYNPAIKNVNTWVALLKHASINVFKGLNKDFNDVLEIEILEEKQIS